MMDRFNLYQPVYGGSVAYRLVAGTCIDGDCPSIHIDDATGDVIVRGPDDANPAQERDIRFTADTWAELLSQL
jgi:hypothetical protein